MHNNGIRRNIIGDSALIGFLSTNEGIVSNLRENPAGIEPATINEWNRTHITTHLEGPEYVHRKIELSWAYKTLEKEWENNVSRVRGGSNGGTPIHAWM